MTPLTDLKVPSSQNKIKTSDYCLSSRSTQVPHVLCFYFRPWTLILHSLWDYQTGLNPI